MPTARISHLDFVVAWAGVSASGGTVAEVVKTTGMTKVGVQGRAKMLRTRGVDLPKLRKVEPGLTNLDIAQMNSRINQITGKQVRQ